jgi:uncharacterized membrane protein
MEKINFGIGAIVAGIFLVLFASGCVTEDGVTGNPIASQAVDSEQGVFRIPISELSDQASFYSFDATGKEVRFFAVSGPDGAVRTAFDACDVCGGRKGYAQQGNDMVCRNCQRHFRLDGIGTKNRGGGCWPGYLDHELEGNDVIIKESDLEAGRWMF